MKCFKKNDNNLNFTICCVLMLFFFPKNDCFCFCWSVVAWVVSFSFISFAEKVVRFFFCVFVSSKKMFNNLIIEFFALYFNSCCESFVYVVFIGNISLISLKKNKNKTQIINVYNVCILFAHFFVYGRRRSII